MLPIISLLLIILLSILVTRVATSALTHTGLSREAARFQARSAFTGAGFTTSESELVMSHPVRRRVVMLLMLLGNAGFVTVVSSLILTFVNDQDTFDASLKVVFLVGGLALLVWLANSRWVERRLSRFIDRALVRMTDLEVRDYVSLLHLAGDYRLVELVIRDGDWLAGKTLKETRLAKEGLVVLGIQRSETEFIGTPAPDRRLVAGDMLVVYGRLSALDRVDQRPEGPVGDAEHLEAVAEQQLRSRREEAATADEPPAGGGS